MKCINDWSKSNMWVKRIEDLCITLFHTSCTDTGLCINRYCHLEAVLCIYTCTLLCIPIGLSVFHNFRKSSGIKFHTSSVLRNSASPKKPAQSIPTEWILYEEMSRYERSAYIRCCTAISPITVALFTGPIKLPPESVRDGAKQHGNNWFTEFYLYLHTN